MKQRILIPLLLIAAAVLAATLLTPGSASSLIAGHDCYYCHSIHGAPGFTLLKETEVEVLCMTCHGPAGISTLKAEVHRNEARRRRRRALAPFLRRRGRGRERVLRRHLRDLPHPDEASPQRFERRTHPQHRQDLHQVP